MSIEKVTSRYELLIRFAEDGTVKGAHQIHQIIVRDTETDEILSRTVGSAAPVAPANVADILGEHGAALTAQVTALTAERDEAVAEKQAAETAKAEAEAQVATLTARIAELTAPPATPTTVSMSQLIRGLRADGWITAEEASAWARRTGLPAPVTAVIAQMPEEQRLDAEVAALTMTEAALDHPLLVGAARVAMPEATDAEVAATLEAAFAAWSAL